MARSRIPGLVDLLRIDDPQTIVTLCGDDRLDRQFEPRGPWLNRFLLNRVRTVLAVDGHPLPAVAARDEKNRAESQEALETRLTALAAALADDDSPLEPLAAHMRRGGSIDTAGPLVQEAVGRLFVPDFKSSPELWSKARLLAAAPGSLNPVKLAKWAATGEVDAAREQLSQAVGGDRAALHAIAIAVHNMVRGVEAMRSLWADERQRAVLTPAAAVARCLFAPAAVLRQPTAPGRIGNDDYGLDTLIVLELDKARMRRPDRNIIFMTQCWSQCPAHAWVPAFFAAFWRRLNTMQEQADTPQPATGDRQAEERPNGG